LVFLLLPAAVTLLTMPMAWYARLTLFLPALAVPIAAVALRALPARPAMAGGVLLVAVAATSLVSANVRPNIDIRVATGGRSWPETDAYLAYLAQPSDADRDNVNLRHECAGFDVIPPGARVTPGGFNLLHGVVGPSLDRILTAPLTTESSGADIASAMRASGATWIVTQKSTDIDKLVAASPRLFLAHGDICQDGRLWQLEAG
jgi:hypothetical protein